MPEPVRQCHPLQPPGRQGADHYRLQPDGHCSLTVDDNGIGIPREAQASVFERFYRVDKSRSKATGGTGLGLAIVKHIARIHNARIKLESQVDVGTTITVTFPTAS